MKKIERSSAYFLAAFVILISSTCLFGQEELGKISWLRNYDLALEQAEETGKPILLLFQEVPGCATCRNYGNQVLSHPLIVDAIEHEFIPLAIYNNVAGADRKVLDKYGEPAWNNPVIRIVDEGGEDVISRLAGNYSAEGLVGHMNLALRAQGKGLPVYMDLLQQEFELDQCETAYYQMYCFWSGESKLGVVDGVVSTEPGFMNGAEVVKVLYDPKEISIKELNSIAKKSSCNLVEKTSRYKVDKDPQYYLKKSPYRYLPLLDSQKTKINAALAQNKDPEIYLSPTQLAWLKVEHSESLYEKPLQEAWELR